MSSSILTNIQTQMNFYGNPVIMVLGIIGNIFVLILFHGQRHNSCVIYLMNAAVTNILYLLITVLLRIFSFSYNDETLRALILCKLSNYAGGFLGQVSKTLLVLACIDRYLITSDRVRFRAFSTPKRAKYFVFFTYVLWSIVASHIPVWLTISNGQCTKVGLYVVLYAFYAILFIGLIPSITLCVFTYLTYRNLRQIHGRIHPIIHNANSARSSIQRRGRNLLVLVIAEVAVYIVTTSLFPLVHLETMISNYMMSEKSVQYIQAEVFALNVALLLIFIFSAAPFYTYMVSSKIFREDFKQLIIIGYRKIRRQISNHNPRANQMLPQRDTRV